jgi:L-lactate dehydrogenase complex protein LldE
MRVAFFVTCLADQFGGDSALAAVKLLEHFGCEVGFPQAQTCCGQPAFNAGYASEARDIARHYLEVFEAALQTAEYVVTPSGSCGSMVHHYPELFQSDPPTHARARGVAEKTVELTQFLHDVLKVREASSDLEGVRVAYHDSCHAMRNLGVKSQPRALLEACGATLLPFDESCCGFGGLFSVKLPELATAMMNHKLQSLEEDAPTADVLTSTDLGCLMQLGGGLARRDRVPRVVHIARLLLEGKAALQG